ncbi:hypothetical protein JCM3775_003907 [Rhodotorula graminis]|uniref:Uncharacterized protein n=1 Tax=Rhodotorula graminis (strain WP1) TaxID=578459 RepID=A0A194S6P4_RHOGW|nr:uncharacterized protein RHOBADRAFT_52210 [Rhodotorula graminis WP1]KPV76165.1 hypothetical protein RHOBADRAFT_52210 [Rhodotorula graminis WP1]
MLRKLTRIIYPSPPPPDAGPGPADPVPPSTSPSPPPPSANARRLATDMDTGSANSDTDAPDPGPPASSSRRRPASPTSTSSTRPTRTSNKRKADDARNSTTYGTANKRARARADKDDRDQSPDEHDSLGHPDGPMTKAVARRFDDQGSGAGNYKRMTGPAFDAPIYLGDVVEMRSDGSSNGGWYGCVELIRALKESVTKIRDRDPSKAGDLPQYLSTEVGLQLSWFFSKTDLEALDGEAGKACKGATVNLGPNERVKGDCLDWNWQSMIVSKKPEIMYVFNDAYPRRAPLKYTISWHPLAHYSTRDLRKVAPSITHFSALETPSRFPDDLPPLPDYYFGTGYPGYVPPEAAWSSTAVHAGKGEPLGREGDGVRQIPYVRVGFSFLRHKVQEDEAMASTAAGKKAKALGRPRQVNQLNFVSHSFDNVPYNPRKVQRYSRTALAWYNVDDLYAHGCLRWKYASSPTEPAPAPAPAPPPAPSTPKAAPYPPVTPQRRRPVPAAFTIEIPPPRTPSSRMPRSRAAAAVASSSWSSSPAPSRDNARYPPPDPPLPAPDHYADAALFDGPDTPYVALHKLAQTNIMRGGTYGLTGNAYLVDCATVLANELRRTGDMEQTAEERDELWAKALELLESADEWDAEVQRRVRGDGGAATLAPEWRSDGNERLRRVPGPDDGEEGEWVWSCPISGREI